MNKATVRVNANHGFVGFDGVPVLLVEHDEYDAAHPYVQARPDLFDKVPEEPKRPAVKTKAKGVDD